MKEVHDEALIVPTPVGVNLVYPSALDAFGVIVPTPWGEPVDIKAHGKPRR